MSQPLRTRRHSWEKLEEHRYRCRRDDCRVVAVKTPDRHGPSWTTTWTWPDGRVVAGGRTPNCEPAVVEDRKPWQRPSGCGHGVGGGQTCGAEEVRLYPCGQRCRQHAPWAIAGTGDPDLKGQSCLVRGYRRLHRLTSSNT